MAKLIYSSIASVDGYIEDSSGNFDWGEPDEEVHGFVNDLEREVGTSLYGRRMYEVMTVWETLDQPDQPPPIQDFARIWQSADKVVYSKTLEKVSTARTRLKREFDPDAIREMKGSSDRDLSIGGPGLAAHAFRAGLIVECHLFHAPVAVGGGKLSLPDMRVDLELQDQRRFESGFLYVRYRVKT